MITILLKGLPDSYESCRQNLQLRELSLHQVIEALRTTEASMAPSTTALTNSTIRESANRATKKNSDDDDDWKKRIKCFNCGKRGHMSRDCSYDSEDEKSENRKYSRRKSKRYARVAIEDSTSDSDESAN
jgi:hypothetical protein